ncbi:MAG: aminotransferase class V-fold PLP-dependent enzyme, partial [Bacteroidetes bacterium]|nr:aminotransferase class V-fold PLP-dependent enzyme [Bacteroidota bacterium]
NITGPEIAETLAQTQPRIAVHSGNNEQEKTTSLRVTSGQMQPGNDKIVADRIFELLSKKYPKPKEMAPPAGNIAGRWAVDIEFYSSKSQHAFILEQDGNWIQGSHKGDFSFREMVGTIDGDQVKLSSSERMIADNVPFIFSGTLSGDTITGQIYMGEYINASFKAVRNNYRGTRRQIRYPKGQPLAT